MSSGQGEFTTGKGVLVGAMHRSGKSIQASGNNYVNKGIQHWAHAIFPAAVLQPPYSFLAAPPQLSYSFPTASLQVPYSTSTASLQLPRSLPAAPPQLPCPCSCLAASLRTCLQLPQTPHGGAGARTSLWR